MNSIHKKIGMGKHAADSRSARSKKTLFVVATKAAYNSSSATNSV